MFIPPNQLFTSPKIIEFPSDIFCIVSFIKRDYIKVLTNVYGAGYSSMYRMYMWCEIIPKIYHNLA